MADFSIKQHDTRPVIQATLLLNGSAVDLTTAVGVAFIMAPAAGGAATVNSAATIVTPADGVVSYTWAAGDTDTVGSFEAEWEVTWDAGPPVDKQTFPTTSYHTIDIVADLDGS